VSYFLTSTSDKIQVVTSAVGTVNVHASWADVTGTPSVVTVGRTNTSSISTAATTDVVAPPAASTQRSLRGIVVSNDHATVAQVIKIQHTDGTLARTLWEGAVAAGEQVNWGPSSGWVPFDVLGRPKDQLALAPAGSAIVAQIASHSADTYYGANMDITNRIQAGSWFRWRVMGLSKTAGTTAPIFNVRVGTAGAIADTARATVTLGVQTAVVDQGEFDVLATFRAVGAGTSAVIRAEVSLRHNLLSTGFATTPAGQSYGGNTGAGFDSTPLATKIGLSVNPGTSGAWVVESCVLDAGNLAA
jgi:hypothetical protein